MKKKKNLAVLIMLILIVSLSLVSCKKNDSDKGGKHISSNDEESIYYFQKGNTKVILNAKADEIISALGEYNKFTKVPSCAYEGDDKIYSYDGFNVYINEIQKEDIITSIVITSDLVSTPEGLKIGDSDLKVADIYGKKYDEESGVRIYKKSDTELRIVVENDAVTSIEYYAIR